MMKLKNIIAISYFYLLTIIIPLFFEYAYFNMHQAKGHIYIILSFLILTIAAVVTLIDHIRHIGHEKKQKSANILHWPEKSFFLFSIIALVSAILSGSFSFAFLGTKGWSIGAYTIVTLWLTYHLLTRWLIWRDDRWNIVFIIYGIILLIGILHSCKVDVLFLHDGIYEKQWFEYLTTIGHKNWYVGFLSIVTPLFAWRYLLENEKKPLVFYGILTELALWNVVLCDSDGIYLGLGLCTIFALPYVLKDDTFYRRATHLILGYGMAILLIEILPCFEEKRHYMSGISKNMLSITVSLAFILLGLVLHHFLKERTLREKDKRCILYVLELIIIGVALCYVIYTMITFDDNWGNYRGEIWRTCMECFHDMGWKDKLIGIGPEMLRDIFSDLSEQRGMLVLVAHSEPIQILLTLGVSGILCWGIGWGSLIYLYIRKLITSKEQLMFFLPMIAYLGQSLVNSATTTNVVLLCMIAVMLHLHTKTNGI